MIKNPPGLLRSEIIEPAVLRNALLAREVAAHLVLVHVANGVVELVMQPRDQVW